MLGLIVITADTGAGLPPQSLFDSLLGAPLLARGIAAALPVSEAVTAVLVVPQEFVDRAKAEVVERFGLDEVERIVAGGPDRKSALKAGLAALPEDVDVVLVQEGARGLVPVKVADAVVAAARQGDAAVPAAALKDTIVADEGGSLVALDVRPSLRALQGPAAYKRAALAAALNEASDADELEVSARLGATITLTEGDDDNRLLRDSADVSRAIEVFSRRAADYAFIYPSDLLPDDPLQKALDPSEAR